jgi:hypothetical protein
MDDPSLYYIMETLYRKKSNGRYEPAEYTWCDSRYQPGLWLIQGELRPTSWKNIAYYVSGLPDPVDTVKWLKLMMNEDVIINALKNSKAKIYDVSLAEAARDIMKEMYLEIDRVEELHKARALKKRRYK